MSDDRDATVHAANPVRGQRPSPSGAVPDVQPDGGVNALKNRIEQDKASQMR